MRYDNHQGWEMFSEYDNDEWSDDYLSRLNPEETRRFSSRDYNGSEGDGVRDADGKLIRSTRARRSQ